MNGDRGAYPEEVEIAPGIYLTQRGSHPKPPNPAGAQQDAGGTIQDNAEWLQQETARLRRSVELLLRSNQEMRDSDPGDPDFVQAIDENVAVIERQIQVIRKYEERIKQLLGDAAPPNGSAGGRGCDRELVDGTWVQVSNEVESPSQDEVVGNAVRETVGSNHAESTRESGGGQGGIVEDNTGVFL
ncbi:uncharacterized protein SPPG_02147 [Spizellomyces punctatus DAOM BR117]|uniref:Uncharacterized protein n=1 Tax=Spizellomyces punctatus (strain DAOM BR117) TaxID=645134 RepID=A0A0L0HPS9_SPIPD|nr:uncharacterized protein SPPG_02147 [Spizellomyces punctatus DAOM BR117]KND03082.1 hypothetical protein SPPG_02147 [Spizellomyces punctatus DAOM BR117]|eukprot:XP_016611121.1 hypothetical protein SPPG_02147 [Spizellomyces punctatus DAOM BR117]